MSNEGGSEEEAQSREADQEIPFALREYGEIPKGYVPLYIYLNRESLSYVAENGFRVIDNQAVVKHGKEIENIFLEAGKKRGVEVSRTSCVFASPRPPHQIKMGLPFDEDRDVLLEVMVDPRGCVVVGGEEFSGVSDSVNDGGDMATAKRWADSYWRDRIWLVDYLAEGHDGSDDDDDILFPEVLIPHDIRIGRIKVVENYRNTKYD